MPTKPSQPPGPILPRSNSIVRTAASRGAQAAPKPIRILLCNPNSTAAMTRACVDMVLPTLSSNVVLVGCTALPPAPSAIEGKFDDVMSAAVAVQGILQHAGQFDAFLVASYSDHALIAMLREELTQPVVGIFEASLFAAQTLGSRFGVLCSGARARYTLEDSVRSSGFAGFCVGVRSCEIGVLGLQERPRDEVMRVVGQVGKELVADGADVVLLGFAGMADLKAAVEEAVGEDVQVIDGVVAGVHHLIGLCRMGSKTAKRGAYASSGETRERRGQDWL
ncbi:Asp/Glu/Hydantoin racemase-domain-containing protein [Boeremia exigua]|uniref:Asp/Glu/Hydantoin racemase-domain-containing protein n=1 Tax=Boeremia exigua TaxID=749465 RepID=UPI001E8E661F|nr:Asp/Glu/Hydantoin racemase-domain-containing protein [Boeremia exigua]KAH6620433.1 Asp/Glu/Hydantoin racemase-domain-containing protein [Boeremia exigua]